jgi:release factor glutamine methyltransferase
VAVHHPGLQFVAGDVSQPVLRLARANVARHAVAERVWPVQADLLPVIGRRYDLICANLPYIPRRTLAGLRVRRWEPALALDGGPDGLDLIRLLLAQAVGALAANGLALLEIEATQGAAAAALARSHFPGAEVSVVRDLAGRDRLVRMQAGPL